MNLQRPPLEGRLIVFFHQSSDMYGSDRILLRLAQAVQEAGGRAVVLLPDTGPLTEEFARYGIEFHALQVLKISRSMMGMRGLLDMFRAVAGALRSYDHALGNRRVDMVHSNTIAVLGGAVWARRKGIPHLWHVHEIIEHPWIAARSFPLLVGSLADIVVCNSQATYQWLFGVNRRLRKKMRVIRNGVELPVQFDDSSTVGLVEKFRPAGVRLAIGLVGRISRLKGHALLMDAVELLRSQGMDDFSVVFVGSPPPHQEIFQTQLEQRIARSPLRERIVLQGFTPNVWPVYAALDIVCVPSTEPESFGLVASEALAAGKPVVASSLGALGEVVSDGITGLTFNPRDVTALAAALATLLSDDSMRMSMGNAGKERINALFSIGQMTSQFIETYTEVTAKK